MAAFDPYKNFRFLLKWDGKSVAGFSHVSGFEKTSHLITLERGVTQDIEFEQWASLRDFRKDLVIELRNEAGEKAIAYTVRGCLVSDFQAMPDPGSRANALTIEVIQLEIEGWKSDERHA